MCIGFLALFCWWRIYNNQFKLGKNMLILRLVKKHVLLTKNMLFYKSAKQNVRQTDKKQVKSGQKG